MKKCKVLLWLCLCVILLGSATTVKAADTSGAASTAKTFSSEESYTKRSFTDLYHANELELASGITASENTAGKGMLLTGSADAFGAGRIKIIPVFNFSGNRIARVSLDALAAYGEHLKVSLYLDDETEAFATITPKRQGRSDLWTAEACIETDVLSANIKGQHSISMSIENEDAGKTAILLRSIEFVESGLPSIYMNIDESLGTVAAMNQSSDHSVECFGSMTVEIPAGYEGEFGEYAGSVSTEDSTASYEVSSLRGRGNSTWELDKKPYRLKLSENAALFGMGAEKNWTLLANRYDNSKLRNQITYWLGRDIGFAFTPKCVQVDLIINGVYYGNYLLAEQIRVGKNRVAIDNLEADEATKQSTDPSVISGGYLISVDGSQKEDEEGYKTDRNFSYIIDSPSFDGYTNETQLNYIKNYIQKTEDAIFGDDFKDKDGVSYTEYMDIDSAADYFWIQEFSKNGDAFETDSTYFYKVRNGKLYWGPLWDFDSVAWNCSNDDDASGYYLLTQDTKWFKRLLTDPVFVSKLTSRWSVIRKSLLTACKDGGQIDKYYDQMSVSMRYDVEKWDFAFSGDFSSDLGQVRKEGETVTFSSERDRLKTWIKNRVQWIDNNLSNIQGKVCTLTFKVDGKTYCTKKLLEGQSIDSVPSAPTKKGYYFDGWTYYDANDEQYVSLTDGVTISENMTLDASYVSTDEIIFPKSLCLDTYEMWITVADFQNLSEDPAYEGLFQAEALPEDAYGSMSFSSSDESILKYEDNTSNNPTILKTGDVTVTVTFGALRKSCLVHIYDPEKTTIGKSTMSISKTSLSLKKGQYQQLTRVYSPKMHTENNYIWISLDSDIASVDKFGVVTAQGYGTTYIILRDTDTGRYTKCKVTVPAPKNTIKKGSTYTYKGLKYKVTYKAKKGGNVTILGPTGRKIKRVNIRTTLKIKGETYKVTSISSKAFYKCKNLRKIYMGKNIKSIGNKAFTGINKKAVFRVPASKKKAYKKLLTSKKGFRKTMKVTK